MSIKSRMEKLECKFGSKTGKEMADFIRKIKTEKGDTSPTPNYLDAAEFLKLWVNLRK